MHVFITGAAGYIGGSVATLLMQRGHRVRGLVRSADKAGALAKRGIVPVLGDLDDADLLASECRWADGVLNAASSDHAAAVHALIEALAGSGKPLIHTSATSVIGDDARGGFASSEILDERSALHIHALKKPRRDIDLAVLDAAARDIRTVVI